MAPYQLESRQGQNGSNMISRFLGDGLKTFRAFQVVIAGICILIPLFLRLSDHDTYYPNKPESAKTAQLVTEECGYDGGSTSKICKDKLGFRLSLSDYVYSSNSYIFGMLYCMAAMLFIFNGAVYFKCQQYLDTNRKGKWYNVILGLSLIGVVLNPQHAAPFWHNAFTIVFFVGNILVIAFLHQRQNRTISIILALATIVALILALIPAKVISILTAEWISLTAIATYLIIESLSSRWKNDGAEYYTKLSVAHAVPRPTES